MSDIKFEIKNAIATVSTSPKGWTKELNLISWNDAPAKFDLREWAPEHEKMGKGVTLTEQEAMLLCKALMEHFGFQHTGVPQPKPAPQPAPTPAPTPKEEPAPTPVEAEPVPQDQLPPELQALIAKAKADLRAAAAKEA